MSTKLFLFLASLCLVSTGKILSVSMNNWCTTYDKLFFFQFPLTDLVPTPGAPSTTQCAMDPLWPIVGLTMAAMFLLQFVPTANSTMLLLVDQLSLAADCQGKTLEYRVLLLHVLWQVEFQLILVALRDAQCHQIDSISIIDFVSINFYFTLETIRLWNKYFLEIFQYQSHLHNTVRIACLSLCSSGET